MLGLGDFPCSPSWCIICRHSGGVLPSDRSPPIASPGENGIGAVMQGSQPVLGITQDTMRNYLSVLSPLVLLASLASAQITPTTFEGLDASNLGSNAQLDVDPNGAVGTKQYMEWVNPMYQAWDKTTLAKIYSAPVQGDTPWRNNNISTCYGGNGDGVIMFDHLASRWVIARRQGTSSYYYCVAVSSTDDLTASG